MDAILQQVCAFLDYDPSAPAKLIARANAFAEANLLFTTKALLMSAKEELLKSANLVVLWSFIQDLKLRTGVAPPSSSTHAAPALAPAPSPSPNKALADRYQQHWVSLGNTADTIVVQLSSFDCILCLKNCLLRSKTDLSRHSQGPTHQQALAKKDAKGDKKRDAVGGNDVVSPSKAKKNKQDLDDELNGYLVDEEAELRMSLPSSEHDAPPLPKLLSRRVVDAEGLETGEVPMGAVVSAPRNVSQRCLKLCACEFGGRADVRTRNQFLVGPCFLHAFR